MRCREKSHSRESAVGEGGCFSKLPINRGEITGIGIISVFDRTTHPRQFSAMLSAVLGERERERAVGLHHWLPALRARRERLKGWLVTLDSWPREPWTEANWFVSTIYISLLFPPIALISRASNRSDRRVRELWLIAARIILAPSFRATLRVEKFANSRANVSRDFFERLEVIAARNETSKRETKWEKDRSCERSNASSVGLWSSERATSIVEA